MPNREQLRGHWNEVKGRLKEHWAQLTEDDLRRAEGSADRLVGVVQQKTGATRSEVERFLDSLFSNGVRDQAAETVQQYSDAAQKMAAEASQFAKEQAQRFAAQSGDYSAKVAERVRTRPGETLAIAFGLGIAAGAFLFLGRKK
ncbi:CsbD family protein [Novipirellula rosea]|mgnify:FL=1|uniref:CsbD family protein n=1 Tax=Novipirellula rosea TaxID=1031540 RepID=A0ABP8MS74_9BACT|tara:strand:+ start:5387 stop:5818 length:432 start_codon:yes stop_codon:yes gene_type:complete